MLVQVHEDGLRLIRQQDHAQLSGALAHDWRVPAEADPPSPLPYRVAWTAGVHDSAWVELDRRPDLDPASGRPFDFHRLPLDRKLGAYRDGIERVAGLDPYAGLQVSRHYCSFLGPEEAGAFLEAERERQSRLRKRLPPSLRRERLLDRELAYLKLFDTLSLYLCLADPASDPEARPEWLVPDDRVETPAGLEVDLRWESPGVLAPEPSPLAADLRLQVPFREVGPVHRTQDELEARWREAPVRHHTLKVLSGG